MPPCSFKLTTDSTVPQKTGLGIPSLRQPDASREGSSDVKRVKAHEETNQKWQGLKEEDFNGFYHDSSPMNKSQVLTLEVKSSAIKPGVHRQKPRFYLTETRTLGSKRQRWWVYNRELGVIFSQGAQTNSGTTMSWNTPSNAHCRMINPVINQSPTDTCYCVPWFWMVWIL